MSQIIQLKTGYVPPSRPRPLSPTEAQAEFDRAFDLVKALYGAAAGLQSLLQERYRHMGCDVWVR